MKTLSEHFGKTLQFIQPSIWKRSFELRDANEVIGTLVYPKFFSVKAEVNILDTKLEFYEPKWWKNLVEARDANRTEPLISFKPALIKNQSELELPHGESLILKSNLFSTALEILDHHNVRLVLLKSKMSMRTKFDIQIEKRSEVLDKYPWVILLVIYIDINKRRRRSAG